MTDPPAAPRTRAALVLAIVAISFAAIFFKAAHPTHPLIAAAVRLTIAASLMAPIAVWRLRRRSLALGFWRGAVLGGVCYAVHFGAWVWSLTLTSVAASVTLVTATPLVLGVLGACTGRDRPSGRLWLAVAGASVGVAIIGAHDLSVSEEALAGDALALLGALAMAIYLLVVRRMGEVDVWALGATTCAVGAALLWGTAWLLGLAWRVPSWAALCALALAALIPQLIGHNLLAWSLRHVSPTLAGIATLGEPVGASILGWLWLGEVISPAVAFGSAVTLASVWVGLSRRPTTSGA